MKIDNPNNYEITEKYTIKSVVTHTETDKLYSDYIRTCRRVNS